jgi:CRP-like cAMP-binding protein/RsiW-degrading membrane proteinase PrsW (M82 family)
MNAVILISYAISVAVPALSAYIISAFDLFGTNKRNIGLICMAWGAVGAFGAAYIINTAIINGLGGDDNAFQTVSTRTAPFAEEFLKALILLYFIQRPSFRYFIDGAIYGFSAGIGFAMTENIFYVYNDASGASITLAISRVLSAALMHATASAVVGISLGLSRRTSGFQRAIMPAAGILFAVLVHFIYNNVLFELEGSGSALLLVAIGIGLGGGVTIAMFINSGLEAEKERFTETLGIGSGITTAERKAVQQLGSGGIEDILSDMTAMFGEEKTALIRQLLVVQANIGILKNNLQSPVNDRLKKAWEKDIDNLKLEMNILRGKIGTYSMTLLRSLIPDDDSSDRIDFNKAVAEYDPNHVHSFDMFMVASKASGTLSAEQIERLSTKLKNIAFFENVDLADLDNLSRAIEVKSFSHGEKLFSKGDSGEAMYLIDRGYIDIFLENEDNTESLLRTFEAGDVVGELALLDGQPRSASARANGPLRVMILQRRHFNMFIQSRPKVILAVLQFLAEKVRYTTGAVTADPTQKIIIHVDEHLEETSPMEIVPIATDSLEAQQEATMGVFGRLAKALDEIEQKKMQDDHSRKTKPRDLS